MMKMMMTNPLTSMVPPGPPEPAPAPDLQWSEKIGFILPSKKTRKSRKKDKMISL